MTRRRRSGSARPARPSLDGRASARLLLAAIAAAWISCPKGARADGQSPLLIMTGETDVEAMELLRFAVEAHLSDLGVEVRLLGVPEMPVKLADQLRLAREASAGGRALSVVWVEKGAGELLILASDGGLEKVLVQSLPRGQEGWEADCDAIAVIVRSALGSGLGGWAPAPIAAPGATKSVEEADGAKEERGGPKGIVSAGYGVSMIDGEGAWVHGAGLSAGVLAWRHLEVDLILHAFESHDMAIEEADLRLVRWPVVLAATGLLLLGRFEAGVRAGLIADFTRVRGLPAGEAPDDTRITELGFAASLLARLRLTGWLAAWVEGGVDLLAGPRDYLWNDRVVLSYARAQPRIGLGLAILFPGR